MKTIETTITVLDDGSVEVAPLAELAPGHHRATLIVEENSASDQEATLKSLLELRMIDVGGWPVDAQFRREEFYGDDGR